MSRSRAPVVAALLLLAGCDSQIVLGDSESPRLVTSGGSGSSAGATSNGGEPSSGGASSAGANTDGTSSAGTAGAVSSPEVPVPGEVVWSTDHESGDLVDWEDGGDFWGGQYEWGDVSLDVNEGAGRDGSLGMAITINTGYRDEPSQGVRVYRRIAEAPAFYTAWFRLEESHTVEDWWSISLFHARDDTLSLDDDVSLWDVRVVDTPSGTMALQFFDLDTMQGLTADTRGQVAPGEWFELAFYLDYQPPSATRIVVLRDGELLFEVQGLHSSVETNVFWAVGNGAGLLTPRESSLYIDDASIRLAQDQK